MTRTIHLTKVVRRWAAPLAIGAIVATSGLATNAVDAAGKRVFGADAPELIPIVWAGLAAKGVGAVAGYVVRFDAYGGSADASGYHDVGSRIAAGVRSGMDSPWSLLPTGTGTQFVGEVTGLVYTVTGATRLGGFFVFAWFSFLGTVLVLRAAVTAVPGLARRRFAVLLFFTPTLVYWGSSTGKEAVVGLLLGVTAYGAAILLSSPERRAGAAALCVVGLGLTARIRPHFAAVWAGALVLGLVGRLAADTVRARRGRGQATSRLRAAALVALALGGFVAVAVVTLGALDPVGQDDAAQGVTNRVTTIFERTEERTGQGGSNFETPSISSPLNWPVAAARTLTRPMLFEARSIAEVLPAIEMTVLLAILAVSWRRLVGLPRLVMRQPFLLFVVVSVVTFGVAFSSIGNLGILVRQRSLILPLMLVLWCLPMSVPEAARVSERRVRQGVPA